MSFAGINYLAVIIAALAAFGLGSVWYMVLSKPWLRATGKTAAELKKEGPAKAYRSSSACWRFSSWRGCWPG